MVYSHRHPAAYVALDQRRAALLRRMADQRVNLWEQVADVGAEALIEIPVFDGWTAKDLLAHVASYDELFTERIRLVLAGRSEEIEGVDPDERNPGLHAERKVWSLDQAVATAVQARTDLLTVTTQLSDTDLNRERDFSFGRFAIRQWIEWRASHDAQHAGDLAAWRHAHHLGGDTAPKSVLLARLVAGREQLLAQLAGLGESAFAAEVIGNWKLKDLLAHISGWDRWELQSAQHVLNGQTPDLTPARGVDGYNAQVVAAWRNCATAELLDELHAARAEWVAILDERPLRAFDTAQADSWNFAQQVRIEWQHDAEHAAQIAEIAARRRFGEEATAES
jgi:uncharacterized damage-inducible protein DinB